MQIQGEVKDHHVLKKGNKSEFPWMKNNKKPFKLQKLSRDQMMKKEKIMKSKWASIFQLHLNYHLNIQIAHLVQKRWLTDSNLISNLNMLQTDFCRKSQICLWWKNFLWQRQNIIVNNYFNLIFKIHRPSRKRLV